MNVEEAQEQFKKQLQEHLRTTLSQEDYKEISCVCLVVNKKTGKLDIFIQEKGPGLIMTVKSYLQEALDMLVRRQIVTAVCGVMISQKQELRRPKDVEC